MGSDRYWRYTTAWALLLLSLLLGERYWRDWLHRADAPRPVVPRAELTAPERLAAEVFAATAPSVAYIFTRDGRGGAAGTGSGLVWDRAGHIVTNSHVVAGASAIEVALSDGRRLPASTIGADPHIPDVILASVAHWRGTRHHDFS